MPIANYPGGFSSGLLVRGVPVAPAHGAKIFYVGNNSTLLVGEKGASNGNKGEYLSPFSTIAYALTQCVSTRGDIIYVRPGHTLTLTGTSDLDINIANVSIIGLGMGAQRPTITVGTAAAATLTVSGASVAMVNFIVKAALDGLNTTMTVTGADAYLDIEHQDTSATVEADIAITVTGDKPFIKIKDVGFTTGDQREAVISANGCDHGRFILDAYGQYNTAAVNFVTAACTDINVSGYVYCSGVTNGSRLVVDTITGSTWWAEIQDGAAGATYSGGSGAALAADDVSSVSTTLLVPTADATSNVDVSDVVGNKTDAGVQTAGTTKSVLAYAKGAVDMIGGVGITTYPAAAVPGNGISIAEVLRDLWDAIRNGTGGSEPGTNRSIIDEIRGSTINYNGLGYVAVTADFTSATWNTIATHSLFTVTGLVRTRIVAVCTSSLAGATATIQLGVTGTTNGFIASTTGTDIVDTDLWYDATPTTTFDTTTTVVIDKVVNGSDIGYEIGTAALTAGSIVFHCWWEPLNATGAVAAGAGGVLA